MFNICSCNNYTGHLRVSLHGRTQQETMAIQYMYRHLSSMRLRPMHTLHSIGKASSAETARVAAACGKRKCIHARLPRFIRHQLSHAAGLRCKVAVHA